MRLQLDELLSELGNPGKYQIFIFLLLCLNYFPLVFNHVVMAFFGSKFQHQCHSSDFSNGQVSSINDFSDVLSIYNSSNVSDISSFDFGKCQSTYKLADLRNVSVGCPGDVDSFVVYKKPVQEENIITQWDLVCDNAYLSSLATTIYFCGVMMGGLVFGHLADKFGRKPIMLITLFLPVLVGIATAFSQSYLMFVVLRFIQGFLMQGLQTTTYTLAMELFLPKHRSYAGTILECFWGLSVMTVPLLAYLFPNWRHLQLVISLPSVLTLFYICVMPESLRWMIMTWHLDEAEAQMTKVSTWNKLEFPTTKWEEVKKQRETMDTCKKFTMLDLLRTPKLRIRSLVLFYIWFAISTGYYGLTWTLTGLPGNKYLNFFIAGAVEFVAYTLVIYITKRFGRKRPLLTYFLLASAFMISAGIVLATKVNMVYLSSGLAIAGKFAMGGLFSVIFLYTSELYPTIIRNIGMGSCAFWTRVGGVFAPQFLFLDQFANKALPMILFGVVTLIGGLLTIILPETLGRKLPDTIEDAENFTGSTESVDAEEMTRLDEKPEDA